MPNGVSQFADTPGRADNGEERSILTDALDECPVRLQGRIECLKVDRSTDHVDAVEPLGAGADRDLNVVEQRKRRVGIVVVVRAANADRPDRVAVDQRANLARTHAADVDGGVVTNGVRAALNVLAGQLPERVRRLEIPLSKE